MNLFKKLFTKKEDLLNQKQISPSREEPNIAAIKTITAIASDENIIPAIRVILWSLITCAARSPEVLMGIARCCNLYVELVIKQQEIIPKDTTIH